MQKSRLKLQPEILLNGFLSALPFENSEISCYARKSESLIEYVILIISHVYLWYLVFKDRTQNFCRKTLKLKFHIFFGNQNLSSCICLAMNPSPTVLDNLKLGRCFWIIFQFLWWMLFLKIFSCNITACLDDFSFEL